MLTRGLRVFYYLLRRFNCVLILPLHLRVACLERSQNPFCSGLQLLKKALSFLLREILITQAHILNTVQDLALLFESAYIKSPQIDLQSAFVMISIENFYIENFYT